MKSSRLRPCEPRQHCGAGHAGPVRYAHACEALRQKCASPYPNGMQIHQPGVGPQRGTTPGSSVKIIPNPIGVASPALVAIPTLTSMPANSPDGTGIPGARSIAPPEPKARRTAPPRRQKIIDGKIMPNFVIRHSSFVIRHSSGAAGQGNAELREQSILSMAQRDPEEMS